MTNKSYAKGYRLERQAIKMLEYSCFVVRQGKSKFPDIIAIVKRGDSMFTKGDILFVECKTNKGDLSKKERKNLLAYKRSLGIIPVLLYKESRGKISMEILASKINKKNPTGSLYTGFGEEKV